MAKQELTYDHIYARAYYAGLKFGQVLENKSHNKERRHWNLMFWTIWLLLVVNCVMNHMCWYYKSQIQDLKHREYLAKEFLYNQYHAGVHNITDQMNALGFEEDVLGLQFQRVEALIDSGVAPEIAKAKVLAE